MSLLWAMLTSRLAGPAAGALAVVLTGLLAVALVGKGTATSRAARAAVERDAWIAAAGRWRVAFETSEALRRREGESAKRAAAESTLACMVRIEAARRSSRAIQQIIQQEVSHDATGCPARGLVPVERLRDALAPGR